MSALVMFGILQCCNSVDVQILVASASILFCNVSPATAFVPQSCRMLRFPTGQSSNQRLSLVHGLTLLTIKLACDNGEMLPTCIYR